MSRGKTHIKSYIPDNDDSENAEQPQFRSKSLILQIFTEIREKNNCKNMTYWKAEEWTNTVDTTPVLTSLPMERCLSHTERNSLCLLLFLLSLFTASSLLNEIGKLIHHLYVIICIHKLTMANFKLFLWINILSLYAGRDSEWLKFYYDFYTKKIWNNANCWPLNIRFFMKS